MTLQNISEKISNQKVAIYIRVSTHWQIDKDSLQVQKRELIAYAEMVLGISDYEIFEDPGYSAKNTDRPDYQRMMSRLRSGEFSHLLVWKIDRISRNLLDFAGMYNELKDLGITFVSKNEQFDTSSAIGEAMLKIILVFAELERNMTSERVSAVMVSRASNGQWNGGRVPYGYIYDKKADTFSFEPNEIKVYNILCDRYEYFQSVIKVSNYLNEQGFRTRKGNKWSATAVYKLLTNRFYLGEYVYNIRKEQSIRDESEWVIIQNHHIAAIDEPRFDSINLALKRNKRGGVPTSKTYQKKNTHVFAGLVKCGDCNNNMTATLDRIRASGWRPSIYGCTTRRNNKSACSNKYISDIVLGPFVFNYIANVIRTKKEFTNKLSMTAFENKLLRGNEFKDVNNIERNCLSDLFNLFSSGLSPVEYRPSIINTDSGGNNEAEIIEEQLRKKNNALKRLKTLFLYDDSLSSEEEFIRERNKISEEIKNLTERLISLKGENFSDTELPDSAMEKASYFIMADKILSSNNFDYEKYSRSLDLSILQNFIRSVISEIIVKNGKVETIVFKNGLEQKFIYK